MATTTHITLLGTSGVGKTTLASLLQQAGWFHYSGDYRIATRYLNEPISLWLTALAQREPTLAALLRDDALSVKGKVTIDRLHILSAFVGKLGRDGYDAATFLERQRLFARAELQAMGDVGEFIHRAEKLFGYRAFINDAGGSVCEIDDQALLEELGRQTLFVYLDTDEELYDELQARALKYPKPICYHEDFLREHIREYSQNHGGISADRFDSDDFIRFVTPKMMAHRRRRCLALAARFGVVLPARRLWQIRHADEFTALLARAVAEQRG